MALEPPVTQEEIDNLRKLRRVLDNYERIYDEQRASIMRRLAKGGVGRSGIADPDAVKAILEILAQELGGLRW